MLLAPLTFLAAGPTPKNPATLTFTTPVQYIFFVASAGGTVTPIPEPKTYALMLAGLGAIGVMAKRRRKS